MVLKSIHIKNYRCVREETLYCSPLTVLVGPNGAGKSTFSFSIARRALNAFVPSVDVSLSWDEMAGVQLPMPRAIAKIGEQGYRSDIERKGHGLQRAFIMTMLQYLEKTRSALAASTDNDAADGIQIRNVIIGIKEPELYQHPDRQRHIARVLMGFASISSDPGKLSTQVVYTTHSPHFVGLDRFDDIRLVRKTSAAPAAVPTTRISSISLADLATSLAQMNQMALGTYTADTLRARLLPLMTPWMNEGFFADVVVLVEGDQDRAAILAAADTLGHELERMGFAIIPCHSKNNIDGPALIFRSLGIPTSPRIERINTYTSSSEQRTLVAQPR